MAPDCGHCVWARGCLAEPNPSALGDTCHDDSRQQPALLTVGNNLGLHHVGRRQTKGRPQRRRRYCALARAVDTHEHTLREACIPNTKD
eukprot:4391181-Alexandrium_andersonii.AAC.1